MLAQTDCSVQMSLQRDLCGWFYLALEIPKELSLKKNGVFYMFSV